MTTPEAVFVSYRLGGADGVAVEAAKWERALRACGFETRRVAGAIDGEPRTDDSILPFLAIDPEPGALTDPDALAQVVAGADLVIVENLCSLPLNLDAANVAKQVFDEHPGRVLFHHHDFAWERPHLAHITGFPPDRRDSLHVTISAYAQTGLRERGIEAQHVPNSFDFDAWAGDRTTTRATFGFDEEVVLLVQPTRAIPRKNVAGGLAFATEVAARLDGRALHYWITGPAEDGFDRELARLLSTSSIPVHVGRARQPADAYAAADLVVFPSTWEGFGNPVVESVAARRMVATADYPVLREIRIGMELLSVDQADDAVAWMRAPAPAARATLDANYGVARARYSIEHLADRIRAAFATVGWERW